MHIYIYIYHRSNPPAVFAKRNDSSIVLETTLYCSRGEARKLMRLGRINESRLEEGE